MGATHTNTDEKLKIVGDGNIEPSATYASILTDYRNILTLGFQL